MSRIVGRSTQAPEGGNRMSRTLREQLIGAWKLVSYVAEPMDGSEPFYPLGEKPNGIILYHAGWLHVRPGGTFRPPVLRFW